MKIYFFIVAFCLSFCLSAQTNWHKDGHGFNSCFQKIEKGSFIGKATGVVQIEYKNGDSFISAFNKDSARLDIVPDLNSIYDISYKDYKSTNNDLQLLYRTYGYANAIVLSIGSKEYYLSLIDGGCDLVINGLEYEYITINDSELLILHFSCDVGLCTTKCYTVPELFIKMGSTLIFNIRKN